MSGTNQVERRLYPARNSEPSLPRWNTETGTRRPTDPSAKKVTHPKPAPGHLHGLHPLPRCLWRLLAEDARSSTESNEHMHGALRCPTCDPEASPHDVDGESVPSFKPQGKDSKARDKHGVAASKFVDRFVYFQQIGSETSCKKEKALLSSTSCQGTPFKRDPPCFCVLTSKSRRHCQQLVSERKVRKYLCGPKLVELKTTPCEKQSETQCSKAAASGCIPSTSGCLKVHHGELVGGCCFLESTVVCGFEGNPANNPPIWGTISVLWDK